MELVLSRLTAIDGIALLLALDGGQVLLFLQTPSDRMYRRPNVTVWRNRSTRVVPPVHENRRENEHSFNCDTISNPQND